MLNIVVQQDEEIDQQSIRRRERKEFMAVTDIGRRCLTSSWPLTGTVKRGVQGWWKIVNMVILMLEGDG